MAFVNNEARDQGLDWIDTNGTRLDICSQEPTTYAEATDTYSLGNAAVNTGATTDASGGGRRVTVPAVNAASVSATGTATHWALTDGSSVLVATGPLASNVALVSGGSFNTAAFDITNGPLV